MTRGSKVWLIRALIALSVSTVALGVIVSVRGGSSDSPSTCYGKSSRGALRDAWKLPRSGPNFRAYSDVAWLAGRTFVHSSVHGVVLGAYERLKTSHPENVFVYGETGLGSRVAE